MYNYLVFTLITFSVYANSAKVGAFGSCGSQDKPMPILHKVTEHKADVFVYLGDNIYGDTKDMKVLENKYNKLGAPRGIYSPQISSPINLRHLG